jgi:RHS repeat-associated protein
LDEAQARNWLGNATARHIYYFGEIEKTLPNGTTVMLWEQHPPCACGIVREQHVNQLQHGAQSPIQAAFEYSDGTGSVLVKKIQAEPEAAGQPLRWVASGKTILNNKGKPVKRYEPYFSAPVAGHRFEEPAEVGVTAVLYYDAIGRTVRTEMPDGTYSRVQFSPWHVRTFDANDTVTEPGNAWFARKTAATATAEEKRDAQLAAEHADTPALTILDSLGREGISIAHNRVKNAAGELQDEKYLTFTKFDAEGKPLWIRDARKNLVMQYITPPAANNQATDPVDYSPCYDIAGNLLFQHSMDAGDRWTLNDAAGKPILAWDNRGHMVRTEYDQLHRPVASFVKGADPLDANRVIQFEKVIYGDTRRNGLPDTPEKDQTRNLNLRGKPYQHYDSAGLVTSLGRNPVTGTDEAFDFKGNLLRSTRQLVSDYKQTPDWSKNPALESETFSSSTRFDALNRPIQMVAPHSDQPGAKFNVTRPGYNEANLLERVDVWLEQPAEPSDLLNPDTANLNAVTNIDYDAKGQRTRIEYNEASHRILTQNTYDKETFRLIRLLSTRPAHPEADKRTLQDLSYTYDPVGNITAIHDDAQQTVFFNNSAIAASNAFAYDALYRLIRAEGREHAAQNNTQRDARSFEPIIGIPFPNSPEALQRYIEVYEYDPVGNILALHHSGGGAERWIRRYQYAPDSNRLLATRLPGDPNKLPDYTAAPGYSAKYVYDMHGNMTSMPHLPAMEWDFQDHLSASQQQINNGGTGEKTWYVYDATGQRVRKLTETQNGRPKEERIYLGGYEVYRKYNGNGQSVTLERETLHVMDDKQRVALIETRTRLVGADPAPRQLVRFQLGNHLGSATLELDDQALVISYEEYHSYGSTAYQDARSQTETAKRYRFTGKERDAETGLTYHGARYYTPWLGRWISCDPDGIEMGPNVYEYVSNRPTILIDPNGKAEAPPIQCHLIEQFNIDTKATNSGYSQQKNIVAYTKNLAAAFGENPEDYHAGHHPDTPQWSTPTGGAQRIGTQHWRANLKQSAQEGRDRAVAKQAGRFVRTNYKQTGPPVANPKPVTLPAEVRNIAKQNRGQLVATGRRPPTASPPGSPAPVAPSSQLELRFAQTPGPQGEAQVAIPSTEPKPAAPAAPPPSTPTKPVAPSAPPQAEPVKPSPESPAGQPTGSNQSAKEIPVTLKSGRVIRIAGNFMDFLALAQAKDHDDVAKIIGGMVAWRAAYGVAVKPFEPAIIRFIGAAGTTLVNVAGGLTTPFLHIRPEPKGA